MSWQIYLNDVTVLGNVVKVKHFEKQGVTRIGVEVPFVRQGGDRGSHTMEIDATGDKAKEAIEEVKEGGTIFIKGVLMEKRFKPASNPEKDYTIMAVQMDDYRGYRFMPGVKVDEGYCQADFCGRMIQEPKEYGEGDKRRVSLRIVYNRPGSGEDEKGTFLNITSFKSVDFILKHMKKGDFVHAVGNLTPRKEQEKAVVGKGDKKKEIEVWGLNFNANAFAGIQGVTPTSGGGGGGGGPAKADDSVYDDDLPF